MLSFLLVSCNSKTLTFKGESNNWSGVIKLEDLTKNEQNNTYHNDYEGDLTLKYKGKNFDSIEDLKYRIVLIKNKDYINAEDVQLNDKGKLIGRVSCSDCEFSKGDSEIEIIVQWNGKSESFILN